MNDAFGQSLDHCIVVVLAGQNISVSLKRHARVQETGEAALKGSGSERLADHLARRAYCDLQHADT